MRSLAALILMLLLATVPVVADDSARDSHGDSVATDQTAAGHEQQLDGHSETAHDTGHGEPVHGEAHGGETVVEELAGHDVHVEESSGGGVMGYLAHHLLDANTYEIFGYSFHLPVIPGNFGFLGESYEHGFQVTKHMVGLVVAGLLVIVLLIPGTKRTKAGEVPKGFGNFLEMLVLFIRDEVVYPNMGRENGRKWLGFFLTLFFLILFSNLLGMIPWGTTPTGNVNMTAGLAIATLLGVFFAGIREHGIKYLGTFIPHGVPIFVAPILFPIEVFGLFVKHFALTIRLFANMLAGHTVLGVFIALIATPLIALAAVPGAVAISMLELFVAFLQAYVFVMLGSLFVGMAIHPH
jgi:F-type H+-transporting ATPase subunit a